MSWSFSITDKPAGAKERLSAEASVPDAIKGYAIQGIDALARRHGDDVDVMASGHGHLHNGTETDLDTTSATIEVKAFKG